jgi:cardiolipin synthase
MGWLPSALSASRIVITPFVVGAILAGDKSRALALCVAGGLTDLLDGYLARRFGWSSRVGAWLDAIADKVLLSAVYVALFLVGAVPGWFMVLVFGRDLFILLLAGIGLLFTPLRDFPPSVWGKVSTNVQIGLAVVLLAGLDNLQTPLLYMSTGTTLFSGLHYFHSALKRLRDLRVATD